MQMSVALPINTTTEPLSSFTPVQLGQDLQIGGNETSPEEKMVLM